MTDAQTAEGTDRILAALDETAPDNCPVRDGHAAMHSTCAVCGAEPVDATPEPPQRSPLQEQLSAVSARAVPGNFWWETQIAIALNGPEERRRELIRARDVSTSWEEHRRCRELLARLRFNAVERIAHLVAMADRNAS